MGSGSKFQCMLHCLIGLHLESTNSKIKPLRTSDDDYRALNSKCKTFESRTLCDCAGHISMKLAL